MNFFKEIFSIDNDKNNILKENRRLKAKTKNAHKKMEEMEVRQISKGVESNTVAFDFEHTPITQIADYIIISASKSNASDIHFDPRENGMMVRFRIDGDLQD